MPLEARKKQHTVWYMNFQGTLVRTSPKRTLYVRALFDYDPHKVLFSNTSIVETDGSQSRTTVCQAGGWGSTMATSCTSPTPVTTSGGRLWRLSWAYHKLFFSKEGHNLIITPNRLENCCRMVKRLAWVLFLPSRGNQNIIVTSTLIKS